MSHAISNQGVLLDVLIDSVVEWGEVKGLIGDQGQATILGQAEKMMEEATETLDACKLAAQFKANNAGIDELPDDINDAITDGIGDTLVTLILLCEVTGKSLADCLNYAYDEIKGRTGQMIDGQFVKDK